MNVIIVGGGKVGLTLVDQLSKEGHNILLIDNNPKVIEKAVNTYDINGILGNGASYDIQIEANVNIADLVIACTPFDELNILCCLIAKKLGAKEIIARVRNPEYFTLFMGRELGLSMMVNPEFEAALEIARVLRFPAAIKTEPFTDEKVELVEFKIPGNSKLNNLTLSNLSSAFKAKILICAVQRSDEIYIPTGDFILKTNDKIYITAPQKETVLFVKEVGLMQNRIKNVMIIGGGKIAYYLTKELNKYGISVKIIENDEKTCQELSETLTKADIVLGDGSDQELLIEEGLLNTDAIVALTGIDEENIIISLFANSKKIKKVITKVNKGNFYEMLESSGLESIVSPKAITANHIIRYVRGMQNAKGSNICTLYRICNDRAEAIEFIVKENFKGLSIPLKTLKLRKNLLIACIIRGKDTITPNGNDTIEINDKVILVTTNEFLDDLNDILE